MKAHATGGRVGSTKGMQLARAAFSLISAVATIGLVVGCYDSRWGQAEKSARNNAAAWAPARLSAGPAGSAAPKNAAHVFKVRFHATTKYASQTVDWKHDTRDLVDGVDDVLGPGFSSRLDVAAMESWAPTTTSDDLDDLMRSLGEEDAGSDVDFVVGLVGGLPKLTTSFHQLGSAIILGKHIVLRAGTDLHEHDVMEKNLDALPEDERVKLLHDRRRHRAVAVFLHELGHTLGGVHETTPKGLMLPTYDTSMTGFGPATTELLGHTFARRAEKFTPAVAAELLAVYEGTNAPAWDAKERAYIVARLRAIVEPPPQPQGVPVTKSNGGATGTPGVAASDGGPRPIEEVGPQLAEADRPIYSAAADLTRQGKLDEAWTKGKPLFAKYPKVYGVQDLRCQLAMAKKLPWSEAKVECADLLQLTKP